MTQLIWKIPQEELPGIEPVLFQQLDRRAAQAWLEHEPLPDTFMMCEDEETGISLVFRGEKYDLNITLFKSRPDLQREGRGSGVFVISNGAGVATNTVDQLAPFVSIAGMIDLKQGFSEAKIAAAREMVRAVRPDADALVINMISGIALAHDTAAAIASFCTADQEEVPVILRFSGPDSGDNGTILTDLERHHPAVTLARSTRDLVAKTIQMFGGPQDTAPRVIPMAQRVAAALDVRARLGVTLDPERWLTPDRTIEQVFGSKATTRVGILGFGETARFQVTAMRDEGVGISWVVTPTAAKHPDSGIPGDRVFSSVEDAVAVRGEVDIVINYAPAGNVFDAVRDCLRGCPATRLMILVAENVRYQEAIRAMDALEESGTACIGPNSPGVMIAGELEGKPDLFKLGNMPAMLFKRVGGMSVVGRSGTVIFDIIDEAAAAGVGARLAWAIGGDRYTGLGLLESLVMLEQDRATRFIVLNGEAGGIQEQLTARLIATGILTKPVIALVTGEAFPAGVQYGHQGSVKFAEADDPAVKKRHLTAAGVIVVDNPTEVTEAIQEIDRIGWDLDARRRETLWDQLGESGRASGFRWHAKLRGAYDVLYDLVGYYRLFEAHQHTPKDLHELTSHLATIGVDRFLGLLSTLIEPSAFVSAFGKSREYVAALLRGIHEIGIEGFRELVESVFGGSPFNQALAATPWAAADLVNEAHEVGVPETQTVIEKTMGTALFRRSLSEQPWNTAHAFRSINNMRWWSYVRAYDRSCTHLLGDNQLPEASWRRNPWASVKLVRMYDRMPEAWLEQALEERETWTRFVDKIRNDPEGLLELGKKTVRASERSGMRPFQVFRDLIHGGVQERPEVETEIERMGQHDFQALVDVVFTRSAFERSRQDHMKSTARALRIINEMGEGEVSGPQRLIGIFRRHLEALDTPAFRRGVARNLWMVVELLRALERIDPISLRRIVEYVISLRTFNHAVAEHQWGMSQAFRKIGDMGAGWFLETHRVIEEVTHDRECFSGSFERNPRDAVEIVQVVAEMGEEGFARFMADPETREAFVTRMRVCPRNAAHFLREVAEAGVERFNEFVDQDLGRSLLNEMLRVKGCNLVRAMRRVNIVGVEEFRRELRAWKAEDMALVLTPENATEVVGNVKERVLEKRFSDPKRKMGVSLPGQPTYEISEGEVRGLYQSYPEWGDALFKLQGGEEMTPSEWVDLYRLVSGRRRFQRHMVPILTNFEPLHGIRSRIDRGEPLIPEIKALRRVHQRAPHRFDGYFHTLEVLDQLDRAVLPLEFVADTLRERVHQELEQRIDGVSRRHLLVLAAALHDLGKVTAGTEEPGGHAEEGVKVARAVLERFRLTAAQKELVVSVIRYHAPAKIRGPDEPWEEFARRGGLDLLYGAITGEGKNPYPIETILHYHADILGRRGDETPEIEVQRRKQVTAFLLAKYMRQHVAPFRSSVPS